MVALPFRRYQVKWEVALSPRQAPPLLFLHHLGPGILTFCGQEPLSSRQHSLRIFSHKNKKLKAGASWQLSNSPNSQNVPRSLATIFCVHCSAVLGWNRKAERVTANSFFSFPSYFIYLDYLFMRVFIYLVFQDKVSRLVSPAHSGSIGVMLTPRNRPWNLQGPSSPTCCGFEWALICARLQEASA